MNIKVRSLSKYISVEVKFDRATYGVGILDHKEAKELAEHLREVADDLLHWAEV